MVRAVILYEREPDPERREFVSNMAPDRAPFGVLTAYCKLPAKAGAENKPDWVNDTL